MNNDYIGKMYIKYREKTIGYIKKYYTINDDIIEDIYQDVFLVLCEKERKGELAITVSFDTYIISICKNIAKNYLRDKKTIIESSSIEEIIDATIQDITFPNYQISLNILIVELGEPCKSILNSFYYENKNMDEIAKMMNYKTEQVAKNRKHSCMNELKNVINKKAYGKDDLI